MTRRSYFFKPQVDSDKFNSKYRLVVQQQKCSIRQQAPVSRRVDSNMVFSVQIATYELKVTTFDEWQELTGNWPERMSEKGREG